ncbi:hypothetical protein B0T11DRAFT_75095 [Plectosphaerella cucumerina]|uniref:Secreted protein n=1 Tax=Plectosphaerella cucumerina TaxID=40658 RepID=A0A8K0TDK2_9PEZI|nr:hypothetical protein B0T11DRAFT_75095 [Plectosphaerella cucumerina]
MDARHWPAVCLGAVDTRHAAALVIAFTLVAGLESSSASQATSELPVLVSPGPDTRAAAVSSECTTHAKHTVASNAGCTRQKSQRDQRLNIRQSLSSSAA